MNNFTEKDLRRWPIQSNSRNKVMEESEMIIGFYLYGDRFDNWVSSFSKKLGVMLRLWEIKEKERVGELDLKKYQRNKREKDQKLSEY